MIESFKPFINEISSSIFGKKITSRIFALFSKIRVFSYGGHNHMCLSP